MSQAKEIMIANMWADEVERAKQESGFDCKQFADMKVDEERGMFDLTYYDCLKIEDYIESGEYKEDVDNPDYELSFQFNEDSGSTGESFIGFFYGYMRRVS